MLNNARIVLVRTHYAGNLGSVARSMANFGCEDLVLVAPLADPLSEEARRLSTHGEPILRRALVVAELGEAISDCGLVAATSAMTAGLYRADIARPPEEVLAEYAAELATTKAALVFGPEPSGLTNAEIARCHHLIHIPTAATYPALNLAQAVTVCLYEWHRQVRLRFRAGGLMPTSASEPPADHAMQERMFAQLREGLEAIHFLYGERADTLMHGVRQLLGRAKPTEQEVRILFGLARQLKWIARHRPDPGSAPQPSEPSG